MVGARGGTGLCGHPVSKVEGSITVVRLSSSVMAPNRLPCVTRVITPSRIPIELV